MKTNEFIKNITINPTNFKKGFLFCLYIDGIVFVFTLILSFFGISLGIIPQLIYLTTVIIVAMMLGKEELRRILAWRDIPIGVFAAVLVMFFGLTIIRSELSNLFQIVIPVPKGFFNHFIYEPDQFFLSVFVVALLPSFTEEIVFRGIIARRFFKTYSPFKAIIFSALIFGIMHINPWQATNSFIGGIFYGWLYWRYKSIWLCMFLHAYNNILAVHFVFPYIIIENPNYIDMWRHPVWFTVMGIFLFAVGVLGVIVMKGERKNVVRGLTRIGAD